MAFVGAGFSAAANLPGWGDVLTKIARSARVSKGLVQLVRDRIAQRTSHALYEAAQVLEDQIGRPSFLQQLEELLGEPSLKGQMARRVDLLRGIPFRSILTTNFDGILSGSTPSHDAYRAALRPERFHWWDEHYWDPEGGAFTLKLHGDVAQVGDSEDSIVLTRRDYRRRYG